VSRYQKCKTNLDFTEARDSEWQWHQLGHIQVCISLQTDNHASTTPLSFFCRLDALLPPNQQHQSTRSSNITTYFISQVECFQYNNRLHKTLCFINCSRHSIIVDRAHGTGLIILAQTTKFLAAVLNDNYAFSGNKTLTETMLNRLPKTVTEEYGV